MTSDQRQRNYPLKCQIILGDWEWTNSDESYPYADAVVYTIVRREKENNYKSRKELVTFTLDGHTGNPISDLELFEVFIGVAHTLWESAELTGWRDKLISKIIDIVNTAIKKGLM